MTFVRKYSHLGDTELIRIPKNSSLHIQNLFERYNLICEKRGEEFMYKIQKSIESRLDNYLS